MFPFIILWINGRTMLSLSTKQVVCTYKWSQGQVGCCLPAYIAVEGKIAWLYSSTIMCCRASKSSARTNDLKGKVRCLPSSIHSCWGQIFKSKIAWLYSSTIICCRASKSSARTNDLKVNVECLPSSIHSCWGQILKGKIGWLYSSIIICCRASKSSGHTMISRARYDGCLPAYVAVEGKVSRTRLDGFTPASLYAVEQASRLGIQWSQGKAWMAIPIETFNESFY